MPRKVVYELVDEKKIREVILEIFIYIILLICASTLGHTRTTHAYYNNKNIENLFAKHSEKRLEYVVTIDDIYSYVIDNYLLLLNKTEQNYDHYEASHVHLKNYALFLGPMRVRQIRVKPLSVCPAGRIANLKDFVCYPRYSSAVSYRDTYQGTIYNQDTTALWAIVEVYEGGGFGLKIPYNYLDSVKFFRQLYDANWIDRASRVILIKSNFYFESDHSFEAIKVIFEILSTGIVIPSISSHKFNMEAFAYPFNMKFVLCLVFYAIVLYYTYQEGSEFRSRGFNNYFKLPLNYPDLIFLVCAYIILFHSIWHFFMVERMTREFEDSPHEYISIDLLTHGWRVYEISLGVLLFSLWLKGIRFISFHRTLQQIASTMERLAKNIAGFFLIFIVTILGFGHMGKVFFGEQLAEFRTVFSSVFAVFQLMIGNLKYETLYRVHPRISALYLIAIIVGIFGILLSLFVAVFLTSYSEIDHSLIVRDRELFKLLYQGFVNMICLRYPKTKTIFIDQLTELIETEKPMISKETLAEVKPMRDLREELARIMESTLQVETTLENLADLMQKITEIQIITEKVRYQLSRNHN